MVEEEEQFTELASSEFLAQQLKALVEAGGQEMLESLPDGIHSGLAKTGAKGGIFLLSGEERRPRKPLLEILRFKGPENHR